MLYDLRDLSCLLRCSLRLNARLQNWHLYFFSGAVVDLRLAEGDEVADMRVMSAAGIETAFSSYGDSGRGVVIVLPAERAWALNW